MSDNLCNQVFSNYKKYRNKLNMSYTICMHSQLCLLLEKKIHFEADLFIEIYINYDLNYYHEMHVSILCVFMLIH